MLYRRSGLGFNINPHPSGYIQIRKTVFRVFNMASYIGHMHAHYGRHTLACLAAPIFRYLRVFNGCRYDACGP